ncbi:Hypothetical predicted protein [Marmota monax]|uniref:Uncharacterized protein n=1 Tax=Marmota monax TaxID=9995 RepID=A0A5E4AV68_MARMO|nr:Hypothetical predicted protein [Marmota monax]
MSATINNMMFILVRKGTLGNGSLCINGSFYNVVVIATFWLHRTDGCAASVPSATGYAPELADARSALAWERRLPAQGKGPAHVGTRITVTPLFAGWPQFGHRLIPTPGDCREVFDAYRFGRSRCES